MYTNYYEIIIQYFLFIIVLTVHHPTSENILSEPTINIIQIYKYMEYSLISSFVLMHTLFSCVVFPDH